jgi:hypothetical protein
MGGERTPGAAPMGVHSIGVKGKESGMLCLTAENAEIAEGHLGNSSLQ